ncbi:ferredoxin family protein [Telmatospirillum siberiense]|uniref:Ferredoxin-like protein n=2 Tax=Telmatospirillum siberiense TaxID=382514 RepID=A0A2N3PW51_9PROT|nr:ferredoxin family protein [Telmatospirillum siberiense]
MTKLEMGAAAQTAVKVEEKLFYNRYLVDAGRPHITVRPHDTPSAALLALTRICPAGCYSQADGGQVEIASDGCMECGTCRVLCGESGDIEWNYPRGGFGVLYKFG